MENLLNTDEQKINKMQFPDYFPKNCPPIDAKMIETTVYRLCESETLGLNDFKSYYQLKPERYKNIVQAYGLSIYLSYQDCKTAIRKSPQLRKKYKYCSYGPIYKWSGKILHTPSKSHPAHYTWWLCTEVKPHTYFKVRGFGVGENDA